MVRHHRATNAGILPFLKPHLIPDRDVPIDRFLDELTQALVYTPQLVWLIFSNGSCLSCEGVGFTEEAKEEKKGDVIRQVILQRVCKECKGEPDEVLHGFLIAYAPEGMNYVFISQCWTDQRAQDEKLADLYFARTKAWAESLGREKVRIETSRDPRGFAKKWNFQPISTTMEFDLTVKEIRNGKEQRTEKREHLDEGSTDVDESASGISESESREGSGSVSGQSSGGVDSAVPESNGDASGIQSQQSIKSVSAGKYEPPTSSDRFFTEPLDATARK